MADLLTNTEELQKILDMVDAKAVDVSQLETNNKTVVGAINELNEVRVDEIKEIDLWLDDAPIEVEAYGGISWEESFGLMQSDGETIARGKVYHKIPLVAGENINIVENEGNTAAVINASINAGVSSTTTLASGSNATASAQWDADSKKINFAFGIPKGNPGESVTITNIDQKNGAGEASTVTFSDGKSLSIKNGSDGEHGKQVQLQKGTSAIEWKYNTDNEWTSLVNLSDLKGSNGSSAYWFVGTAVDGTSSSKQVTVSGSKAGDMYLNTTSYNVYTATAANTWKYVCNIKGANATTTSTAIANDANGTGGSNGLMSAADKTRLDNIWNIWEADGADDALVNKVQEIITIFNNYPEGDMVIEALSKKMSVFVYDTNPGTKIADALNARREEGIDGWGIIQFQGYTVRTLGVNARWQGGNRYDISGFDLGTGAVISKTEDWSGTSLSDFFGFFVKPLKENFNYDTLNTESKTVIDAINELNDKFIEKVTHEWNKQVLCGSGDSGAISLGRYNIYDTQLTFDIVSTTTAAICGRLVIATQNGLIKTAAVYGDASGQLVSRLRIYQSAVSNNRSWIEIFGMFDGWSKNKIHIYAIGLNSATVEKQYTKVTKTGSPSEPVEITNGDTKWTGTITDAIQSQIPSTTKQANWDTAYGWGNHASAGYLTSGSGDLAFASGTGWSSFSIGKVSKNGILTLYKNNTYMDIKIDGTLSGQSSLLIPVSGGTIATQGWVSAGYVTQNTEQEITAKKIFSSTGSTQEVEISNTKVRLADSDNGFDLQYDNTKKAIKFVFN